MLTRLLVLALLTGGSAGCIVDRLVTPKATADAPLVVSGRGYYAAPDGMRAGDGSLAQPWDLATALGGAGVVGPGDTIWLRGGTYHPAEEGAFRSTVEGTAGHPVVVRQYPGERAILDGAGTPSGFSVLNVEGPWTVFWGFEVTNTDATRITTSTATDFRANGVSNYASHTRFVNLVIHDGGVGFYTDPLQSDVEIAGCVIYNNGWQGPDRGHGHGLYLMSNSGPVVARDNVVFNQFGYGVHAYADPGWRLVNIRVEGNVAFNNGTLADNSTAANILLGGNEPASGDVLENNATYFASSDTSSTNVRIGWNAARNGSMQLQGNYFVGGGPVLEVGNWSSAAVTENSFVGTDSLRLLISLTDSAPAGQLWSQNIFDAAPGVRAWSFRDSIYTFDVWERVTGLIGAGDVVSGLPGPTRVIVRPNPYEAGRANIVVYNWSDQAAVAVDLTRVLSLGATYEIRNVQNLFGPPVVAGTYRGGAVTLPLSGVAPPSPIGIASRAPATGTRFNVYIVTVKP